MNTKLLAIIKLLKELKSNFSINLCYYEERNFIEINLRCKNSKETVQSYQFRCLIDDNRIKDFSIGVIQYEVLISSLKSLQ